MKKNSKGLLFRFPRIGGIVFILFISIFALDIFGNGYTVWQTIVGLFMHLIPTWILIIVLILSRKKYELVGAIAFAGFGLLYTIRCIVKFITTMGTPGVQPPYYMLTTRPLIIALPSIAVGLCFFIHRLRMRKK